MNVHAHSVMMMHRVELVMMMLLQQLQLALNVKQ
jgi:hypothetical protein